ncbi:MAG: hypothetical protein WCL16_03350, partial [bacterium]
LNDAAVNLLGYQVNFKELEAGLFLFNHQGADCGTTLAVDVRDFAELYKGPVFVKRMTGSPACLGLCLRRESLDRCPAECECAFVREVLQIVRGWRVRKGKAA